MTPALPPALPPLPPPVLPIGIADFRALREQGLYYVDKSVLIRDLIDRRGAQAVLLPRPRRFGKTLSLSMLRCFFEKRDEDFSGLFEDLAIWQAGDEYRSHFQRYPVIHMTFKDVKVETFEACWEVIRRKIAQLFQEHRFLLDEGQLSETEAREYRELLSGNASPAVCYGALGDLSRYLHRARGEKVFILIDEYDEPIHAGHVYGCGAEVLSFFRAFLTGGLKDNPHLSRAVMTGILRVAKESLFSGLNNLTVYSLLGSDFDTAFGFTEPEVVTLLNKTGRVDRLDAIRTWYNGYVFGGTVVYNPWSVLNYLAREEVEPQPFWVSTSSNDLIRELLQQHALLGEPFIETLLEGGGFEHVLDENVVLGDLGTDEGALWSLLVFSGYLKAERRSRGPMDRPAHFLAIPNREVREVYTSTFRRWLAARLQGAGGSIEKLTRALLSGDAETFEDQLQAFVTDVLSYHDTGGAQPEQVYQAFLAGLLSVLEPGHRVRTNRESGQGRPDVLIVPSQTGKPGVVLELKVAKAPRKTLEQALQEGMAQIQANDDGAELRAAGASPVHAFVVAFDGKVVRVTGG